MSAWLKGICGIVFVWTKIIHNYTNISHHIFSVFLFSLCKPSTLVYVKVENQKIPILAQPSLLLKPTFLNLFLVVVYSLMDYKSHFCLEP